jgi:hypothetical protein
MANKEATVALSRVARIILHAVVDFGGRFGRSLFTDVLLGSQHEQLIEWRCGQAKA